MYVLLSTINKITLINLLNYCKKSILVIILCINDDSNNNERIMSFLAYFFLA